MRLELLSPAQMTRADALTIAAGTPGKLLMERAGAAVAAAARRICPAGQRVMVLCGPGNNGGDGFVTARLLAQAGYAVRVALLGERVRLSGDAALMVARWEGAVEPAGTAEFAGVGLVVDALFGAGLARDLDGEARNIVERLNASGVPVLAVDLPSGIDGETGAVRGVAVRARASVTFFRAKPGHLLMPGRAHVGTLDIVDIGIGDAVLDEIRPQSVINEPGLWGRAFPVPRIDGHKYSRGHLVALSGPIEATGATRLCARAALRAGAGLVTVACPAAALPVHAVGNYAATMVRAVEDADGLARLLEDKRLTTLILGPGLGQGEGAREKLQVSADRRLVIDADLISSYPGAPDELARVLARSPAVVATPHYGEFARLFKGCEDIIGAPSKINRARAAAARLGAAIVLKGADTVVAAPDGRAAVSRNAPPWLATAGSGDTLAGIIGGLLSQEMPAFEAACAGVWLHGEAGHEAGPGLVADDLADALRPVYRRLFARLGAAG